MMLTVGGRRPMPRADACMVPKGALIAFLCGESSSYTSGAIIEVDGAATAHGAGMPFPRHRSPT